MNRKNNQERIDFTEIASGLDDNIFQADLLRESGLQMLHKVRTAKQTGQKRELERLSKKLGEKHARVIALSQKMETDSALVSEVAVNIERAKIKTPKINEYSWILHGLVYSKEMSGVPNLTVGLYDKKGKWFELFGYACTDKAGYFRITHEFENRKTAELDDRVPEAVATAQHFQVFIRLQDKTGALVYIDKQAVTPTPNQTVYREILIGDEPDVCVLPESSNTPSSPTSFSSL